MSDYYEKKFAYQGDATCFNWDSHGLRLHVPEDALPPGATKISVSITATATCLYTAPADSELISGVYCISADPTFSKPVVLEIEHCCLIDSPSNAKQLFCGQCSKDKYPYHFQRLKGGVFEVNKNFAKIELKHFCILSAFNCCGRRNRIAPITRYCASLHYSKRSTHKWHVYLVITKDSNIIRQVYLKYCTSHSNDPFPFRKLRSTSQETIFLWCLSILHS